jgi:hypothetical protein
MTDMASGSFAKPVTPPRSRRTPFNREGKPRAVFRRAAAMTEKKRAVEQFNVDAPAGSMVLAISATYARPSPD